MIEPNRIELHFPDGQIEIVRDLNTAREIIRAHPDHQIRIWTVSGNDVGLGQVVDPSDGLRRQDRQEITSVISRTRQRLGAALAQLPR